ncbi:AraC family transcriptional regulator [Aestuariibacter salexigens]|uniref:AraC family transcriptional regulator n=1 Tax=Aestuariibacter salexigens TaxID=226010 RepID=UPI00040F16A5|nr:AraC family transcriptional regulator [Aestuariibacter salexigens]
MHYYVRIGALDGYVECLNQLGVSPYGILERVNIIASQLNDPDLMIPYDSLGEVLELTATQLKQPLFGTRLSRFQGLSSVGLIGAYMAQQDTVADALQSAQRFSDMHAHGVSLETQLVTEDLCELTLDMKVNNKQQYPQLVQLSLGLVSEMIGDMVGKDWKLAKVCLSQSLKEKDRKQLGFIFGCDIMCEFPRDSLVFDAAFLQRKPVTADNLLDTIMEKQFHERRIKNIDHRQLVKHAINVLLPTGDCSKETIAASLGLHPKKIERLLAKQGCTFRKLLEETRKEIALRSLDQRSSTMMQLALNLGYSDFSAFSRSFKRWTGIPPSQYTASYIS